MSELVEICPSCGSHSVPDAAYCHRCGAPLIGQDPDHAEPETEGTPDSAEGESVSFGDIGSEASARGTATAAGTTFPQGEDPALARALRGEYEIRMGDWMSRGWTVFTRAGGLFIAFAAILWLLFTFAAPILLILGPLISSGFLCAALIVRRGERVRFSDFWLPFNDFLPLFLSWIVSCSLLIAGLVTCGILTLYLWVGYQFVYLLILDRKMEFWDALETSRKVVTRHWLSLFAFAVMLALINLLTFVLTATVGMVLSVPLTSCFLVEAYASIFGVRGGLQRYQGSAPTSVPGPAPAATSAIPQTP